jgi:hypothetical protein
MISTQTMHGFKSISKTGGGGGASMPPLARQPTQGEATLKEASKSSGTPFHRQITGGSTMENNQTLPKMR